MTHLRTYLIASKTSQARLAAVVGVSRSYMNELVSGTKTPSLPVALAIEKATKGKVKVASLVNAGVSQ